MDIIKIAMAAFGGTIVGGLAGWQSSGEDWNWRKFMTTVLTGIGSAIALALTYEFAAPISTRDILAAFLAGIGINTGRVAISNMIALRAKTPNV